MSWMARAAALVDPAREVWASDPTRWARERVRVELWSKQREILQTLRDEPLVIVPSCHSAGKSLTAGVAATWWIDTHDPGTAFVITTAPTGPQVRAVLWREINRLHKRGKLPGRTNLSEWYLAGELVALGRKPSEHNPDAFQGIHAIHLLVILDEACGIPKALWDAASSLASNVGAKILAIGNPDDPHGEFANNCKPNSGWRVIQIGCRDTPNFTGEQVSKVVQDSLISREWVADRARKWGVNSAIYASKCDGVFPQDSEFGVIPYSWAVACRNLELAADDPHEAGIDIGAGGDRTVLRERYGPRAGREIVFQDKDPMKTVGRLVGTIKMWGIQRVKVDVIGVGWGVYGRLRELSTKHGARATASGEGEHATHDAEVVPVNFANQSHWPKRFINLRAEIYWEVGRERSRLRNWDLSVVDDDVLAELTAGDYDIVDSSGKIKIEAKEDIIKRTGHSPDRSDALLLAFYDARTMGQTTSATSMDVDLTRNLTPGSGY